MSDDGSRGGTAPEEFDPEAFRRRAHLVVDWIADYLTRVEDFPVLARTGPGEVRAGLPAHPPEVPEPLEAVLRDVDEVLLPGITHWQSPNFFAYFPANASGPSILGELLSAGLGVQGMLWSTSPACTELEAHVLDWLAEMLDLPGAFRSDTERSEGGGVIQGSGSEATLCALLAARERATDGRGNAPGLADAAAEAGAPVVYASTQAHSSIEKAARIAGLGSEGVRAVEVDGAYAMRPDRLEEAIAADREAGRLPCFVCATVGTTSSGALDPLPEIGRVCREAGVWLHVDAAMAGTAAVCPELRFIHEGLEAADSYYVNPHKWMFTNFDCTAFYVRDRRALTSALGILPEYLRNRATESGDVVDYRDWQVPLGRRFRALKLWLVIRSFGVEGIRARVREHVRLARSFTGWVEADPHLELAAPVPLNLVCFRHRDGEDATRRTMEEANDSGRLFLTHTRLDGRLTLRMSIGQTNTRERHVRAAWATLRAAAARAGGAEAG